MNKLDTYLLTGKLLAKDILYDESDLTIALKDADPDWELFTRLADGHLVLQTIYPKIAKSTLKQFFPEDLITHLRIINEMNTQRTLEIIDQCKEIDAILQEIEVSPMYMKGAANILEGLYNDPGERILHDIDILVREDQTDDAFQALINGGYKLNDVFDQRLPLSSKHYPILFKPGQPVYVEVHRYPVSPKYLDTINTDVLFSDKREINGMKGVYAMSDHHKIIHSFIHSQMEHSGHYYAREFLRTLYDLLLLSQKADPETVFKGYPEFQRYTAGYLDVFYKTFSIKPRVRYYPVPYFHCYVRRYQLSLRYPGFGKASFLVRRILRSFILFPLQAIFDKQKRKSLIIKLFTKDWYRKQLMFYGNFFKK
ncbi:MAG TPA: nucleotidyltransferase family protein [Bacteroidales bacterium]|nr:nucleotidyltransferase family protein [Bacteroidales bacterium]